MIEVVVNRRYELSMSSVDAMIDTARRYDETGYNEAIEDGMTPELAAGIVLSYAIDSGDFSDFAEVASHTITIEEGE